MGQYLSMPDPCAHRTRIDHIRATLGGITLPPCPECAQGPTEEAITARHEVSTTRDRPTNYFNMPLFRLRCTCGWHTACPNRADARLVKAWHLAHPGRPNLDRPLPGW